MTSTRRSDWGTSWLSTRLAASWRSSTRPDTILSSPASEFVARFVGVDRGLKRLSLSRVRDLTPSPAPSAHVGDDAAGARARILVDPDSPWLLLLDARERPLGWVHERRIPAEGQLEAGLAEPTRAILTPWMSLRDALSVMLDEQVITGVVVAADGRALGVLTVAELAAALR